MHQFNTIIRIFALSLLLLLGACGASDTATELQNQSSTPLADEIASRAVSVPMPVRVVNGEVVKDGAGRPVSQWDGSTVDLYAADALAQCAAAVDSGADEDRDTYTAKLSSYIESAHCSLANPPPYAQLTVAGCTPEYCSPVKQWARQRETATCNVDPDTRQPTVSRFYPNNTGAAALPKLPPPEEFTDVQAESPELLRKVHRLAQHQVDSASVNLCMAQRLREYMTSADTLLLSAEDQRQLLDVVRTRAQAAMLRYAQIGRALSSDGTQQWVIRGEEVFLPIFRSWGKKYDLTLQQIGLDFAAAIKLHIDTTTQEARLLARTASARSPQNNSRPRSQAEEDWGAGSWRQRLMALMFGTTPYPNSMWEADYSDGGGPIYYWYGEASWPNQMPPLSSASYYVKTDASDPNVQVLLGLARSADALLLKERATEVTLATVNVILPFRRVDVGPTAEQLYRNVEAWIRTNDCIRAGTPTCLVRPNDPSVPPVSQFEQSFLFKRYGVAPKHATTLVSLLSDTMSRQQFADSLRQSLRPIPSFAAVEPAGNSTQATPVPLSEVEGAFHVLGKHETLSGAALESRLPGATGNWYHLDKSYRVEPRAMAEHAPLYSEFSRYWLPQDFNVEINGKEQQFESWQYIGLVEMGASSALTATSDLLSRSIQQLPNTSTLRTSYFGNAESALKAIDGAVGETSMTIRPSVHQQLVYRQCRGMSGIDDPVWCPTLVQDASSDGNNVKWDISLKTKADDPFFSNGNVSLIAVLTQGLEATAALDPTFVSVAGKSASDYLVAGRVATGQDAGSVATKRRWTIELPALDPRMGKASENTSFLRSPSYYTFFLTRAINGVAEYRLLGRNIGLHVGGEMRRVNPEVPTDAFVYSPIEGQYLAYGGSLGQVVANAWSTQAANAVKPAFDGFGFPTDWVPPVDPSLYASSSSPNAISYYLSSARTAADEATGAVKAAVEELLREQSDEATLQVAQQKAQQIDAIEQRALCGDANPECDTSMVTADLDPYLPECPAAPPNTTFCQLVDGRVRKLLPPQVLLAKPVFSHLYDASPPAFPQYEGGTFQRALIAQWAAYRKMMRVARDAIEVGKARDKEVAAAYAQLAASQNAKAAECSKRAYELAYQSGWSITTEHTVNRPGNIECADDVGCGRIRISGTIGASYNNSALRAQYQACDDAKRNLPVSESKAASVVQDAFAWLGNSNTSALDAVAAFVMSTSDILKTQQDTKLAKAKADLEASLAAGNLATRFGTWRRYHSLDMWRAQALVESARRYAATARRAIEARYVVDLSRMRSDETFVAAPVGWADEVYSYDLNAPAAVGLTARAANGAGAIYANVLSDYVANMSRFVDGYAVSRPTAAVSSDADVVTIGGPDGRETVSSNGQQVSVLADDARNWDFYCAATGNWIVHPASRQVPATTPLTSACNGAAAAKARVTFSLDPWGRLNGDVTNTPYQARHNVRWKRLAVNFAGNGVLDCNYADDYNACTGKQYIHYNFSMTGPMWVTDYDQQWRYVGVPSARIEAAKATPNQFWDAVLNGWGKPGAVAVARHEVDQLPVGGSYQLEFDVPPEVRLERLKYIQVLTETAYWVKQ